jgi:hypothetical protein
MLQALVHNTTDTTFVYGQHFSIMSWLQLHVYVCEVCSSQVHCYDITWSQHVRNVYLR